MKQAHRGQTLKRGIKRMLTAVLILIAVLLLYGVAIEPRFILAIDRQTAVLPHLPPAWNGQRVAVVGDLHVGMWWGNTAMAERAVRQIVAAHPAAVFLLGDFVAEPGHLLSGELRTVTRLLRPLILARLPTYAVLGNHDGVDESRAMSHPREAAQVRQALTKLGVHVLADTAAALPPPRRRSKRTAQGTGPPLYVVGLAPPWTQRRQLSGALRQVPSDAARIVIMHDPDAFPSLPPGSAPLGIAGHTHCGQVRLPFLAHWSWLMLFEPHPVQDGWNDHFGQRGNRLYVNCGISFSVVPLRIDDPPEVSLFTLVGLPRQTVHHS